MYGMCILISLAHIEADHYYSNLWSIFYVLLLEEEFSGGGSHSGFYVSIRVVWVEIQEVGISGKLKMPEYFL